MEDEKKEVQGTSPSSVVEKAEELARRIEEANKKTEELIARQEAMQAKQILGGRTEAGQAPPVKPEISAREYARKVMSGEINPYTAE